MANVHVGSLGTELTSGEHKVVDLFVQTGFRVEEHGNLEGWLWLQFVVGAGLAAQSLATGSSRQLMSSPVELKRAILLIRELFPVLTARGLDLRPFASETAPFRFPAWLGGLILQTTLRSQDAVRIIWEAGDDDERALVCRDVLSEARRLAIAIPRLEALESLFSLT